MARGTDTSGDPRRRDWSAWHSVSGSDGTAVSTHTFDPNYDHTSQVERSGTGHIVHTARVLPGAEHVQPYAIGPFKTHARGRMAADAFHNRAEAKGEDHESVDRYRAGSAFRTLPPSVNDRL